MCSVCWARLRGDLYSVAELADDLDVALARDVHFGAGGIGIVVRSADNPLPPDLRAGDVARQLRGLLGSWVRDLWETHAVRWQECDGCGAYWYSGQMMHVRPEPNPPCSGAWVEVMDTLTVANTLPELAGWLLRHPSWITGHVAAGELWDELTAAIDGAWLAVDRPADLAFLGVCDARVEVEGETAVCGADLYARPGRSVMVCRCGAEYDVAGQRSLALDRAGDQLLSATEISRALPGLLGRPVTAAQVRGLAHRGRLAQYEPHPLDVRCSPRYRVGEVADVIAELASEERLRVAS
jgi:hypothetical protein